MIIVLAKKVATGTFGSGVLRSKHVKTKIVFEALKQKIQVKNCLCNMVAFFHMFLELAKRVY